MEYLSAQNLNKSEFSEYINRFWKGRLKGQKKPLTDENKRVLESYLNIVQRYAPYWLEEFEICDRVLDLDPGTYSLGGLIKDTTDTPPPKTPAAPHECTSWIINPQASTSGRRILHKVRDADAHEISIMRLRTEFSAKCYRWLGLGNLGHMAPCMGINEHGLAIIMNSGERTRETNFPGLTTPNIARCILEQCNNLNDALELYQDIIRNRCYAHGETGSIFMMIDPHNSLVAENSACHYASAKVEAPFLVRANAWHLPGMECHSSLQYPTVVANARRECQVRDSLREAYYTRGLISLEETWATARISKDNENRSMRGVCSSFTNSSSTFELDADYPSLSTAYLAIGPEDHTPFIPMPVCASRYPVHMVDGSWSDRAFQKREQLDSYAELDSLIDLEARMMEIYRPAQAQAHALAKEHLDQAQATLQAAFEQCCAIVQPFFAN